MANLTRNTKKRKRNVKRKGIEKRKGNRRTKIKIRIKFNIKEKRKGNWISKTTKRFSYEASTRSTIKRKKTRTRNICQKKRIGKI